MSKKLILGITASLMVLTGIAAAPARAQSNEELGRNIAGAVTLFILGNALLDTLEKDGNKAKAKSIASGTKSSNGSSVNHSGGNWNNNYVNERPNRGRYGVHPHKVVPMQCYFEINQYRRQVGVFGEQCLQASVKKADWLPRECRQVIPVRHGRNAAVYNAQCLREFGWRTSGYRTAGHHDDDDDHDHRGKGDGKRR